MDANVPKCVSRIEVEIGDCPHFDETWNQQNVHLECGLMVH